jgi:glycolate oxidase iron-sulfur subunit
VKAQRESVVFPARGERTHRVALFTGCLADQLFAGVNEATVRVLTENGCEVEVVGGELCCGALHIHNGARGEAKALAAENVRRFAAGKYDAIISNAAGCSAELRHYGALLDDEAAAAFGAKIRDVCEYLVEIGWKPPARAARPGKLAYDEPCHLVHAQKISAQPRAILGALPGLDLVPLEDADACCGSAGVYSVLQPALSRAVAQRKLDAILRSGATIVATGNPGCILQLRAGLRGTGITVVHPVELLASAYDTVER